jgi:hypothetical protein
MDGSRETSSRDAIPRRTARLLLILCIAVFPAAVHAYEQDVSKWIEVPRPAAPVSADRTAWNAAGSASPHEWVVFKDGPAVMAALKQDHESPGERPSFASEAEHEKDSNIFFKVDDGWLVASDKGEFGDALYWFDETGKIRQKISDHHVVAFFPSDDGVLAVEGLTHLSTSRGSIVRLTRTGQWETQRVTLLPEAPITGVMFRDRRLLLILSNSLAEYFKRHTWEVFKFHVKDADWSSLSPSSIVLADDEKKAYIGMRQYVAEYDFRFRTLRFLVPDTSFLPNPPQEEQPKEPPKEQPRTKKKQKRPRK